MPKSKLECENFQGAESIRLKPSTFLGKPKTMNWHFDLGDLFSLKGFTYFPMQPISKWIFPIMSSNFRDGKFWNCFKGVRHIA